MRNLIILSLAFLFLGCTSGSVIIGADKVKSIVITLDSSGNHFHLSPIQISNRDSITEIIKKIDACEREPLYFFPTHWISIAYQDGREETILCNGSSLKYDGLTYKLKESIKDIIGY
jgi:hypothetical protein